MPMETKKKLVNIFWKGKILGAEQNKIYTAAIDCC